MEQSKLNPINFSREDLIETNKDLNNISLKLAKEQNIDNDELINVIIKTKDKLNAIDQHLITKDKNEKDITTEDLDLKALIMAKAIKNYDALSNVIETQKKTLGKEYDDGAVIKELFAKHELFKAITENHSTDKLKEINQTTRMLIEKSHKEKQGDTKNTAPFSQNDLSNTIKALDLIYTKTKDSEIQRLKEGFQKTLQNAIKKDPKGTKDPDEKRYISNDPKYHFNKTTADKIIKEHNIIVIKRKKTIELEETRSLNNTNQTEVSNFNPKNYIDSTNKTASVFNFTQSTNTPNVKKSKSGPQIGG